MADTGTAKKTAGRCPGGSAGWGGVAGGPRPVPARTPWQAAAPGDGGKAFSFNPATQGLGTVSFFVPGTPAPGGSKTFMGFGRHTGRAILVDAGGERNKNWRSSVAQCGHAQMAGAALFTGALAVRLEFLMQRPRGHYTARGTLRTDAPQAPITRPDTLKLARSTEDALTGVCWRDDAQTVRLHLEKRYALPAESTGCRITIMPLAFDPVEQGVVAPGSGVAGLEGCAVPGEAEPGGQPELFPWEPGTGAGSPSHAVGDAAGRRASA